MKGIIKTNELSFWDKGDKVDVLKCWSNKYGNWVRKRGSV